jgi:hypothetical protein
VSGATRDREGDGGVGPRASRGMGDPRERGGREAVGPPWRLRGLMKGRNSQEPPWARYPVFKGLLGCGTDSETLEPKRAWGPRVRGRGRALGPGSWKAWGEENDPSWNRATESDLT